MLLLLLCRHNTPRCMAGSLHCMMYNQVFVSSLHDVLNYLFILPHHDEVRFKPPPSIPKYTYPALFAMLTCMFVLRITIEVFAVHNHSKPLYHVLSLVLRGGAVLPHTAKQLRIGGVLTSFVGVHHTHCHCVVGLLWWGVTACCCRPRHRRPPACMHLACCDCAAPDSLRHVVCSMRP